jgi:hypothetical protein
MNFRRIPKFLDVSEGGSTSVAMARLVAVWTLGGVGCCGWWLLGCRFFLEISVGPSSRPSLLSLSFWTAQNHNTPTTNEFLLFKEYV